MRSWNVFISFSIVSGMVLGTQNHRESWSDVKGKLVVPEQLCVSRLLCTVVCNCHFDDEYNIIHSFLDKKRYNYQIGAK